MKYTVALMLFGSLMLTSALPQYSSGGASGAYGGAGGGSSGGASSGGAPSYGAPAGGAGGSSGASSGGAPSYGAPAGGAPAPAASGSGAPSYGAPAGGAPAPAASGSGAPSYGAPAGGAPAPSGSGAPSYGSPAGGDQSGAGSSSSSGSAAPGGASGGNLQVECKPTETAPGSGQYKVVCDGVDPNAISLRSEHVLWLSGDKAQPQILDIEIPNYKIEELIKAGFKPVEGQGAQINVLLKKPEQSYDAQVDALKISGGAPKVQLKYEPVEKKLVHFPNDKPYSPLTGPILPPLAGGRPQRQTSQKYSSSYSRQ